MTTLNLTYAEPVTGYLDQGRGEKVMFLSIPVHYGKEQLKEDVKAGAEHLKDLYDYVCRKSHRMTILRADHRDEGYQAVTALAAIRNRAEFADSVLREHHPDQNWEMKKAWVESPLRLPVITASKLQSFLNQDNDPFFPSPVRKKDPYWTSARKEPVLITWSLEEDKFLSVEKLNSYIRYFSSNRHVYLLLLGEQWGCEEEKIFDDRKAVNQAVSAVVLDHTAGMVSVVMEQEKRKEYLQSVFAAIAGEYGMSLSEDIYVPGLVSRISDADNPEKLSLIHHLFRYIQNEKRLKRDKTTMLKAADFAVLDKLKLLNDYMDEGKEKAMDKLERSIIGMENVKTQIKNIVKVMKLERLRRERGMGDPAFHNVYMLVGAPGTCKTTVAELLGNILKEERLLPGNRFIALNGADLKAQYLGCTAPRVHEIFEQHEIILIDEAYSLVSSNHGRVDTYGQEALAQLMVELENHGHDRLIMFAGYGGEQVRNCDNKMKQFLKANPGVQSRIQSTIYFDSYNGQQMLEIFCGLAAQNDYEVEPEIFGEIRDFFDRRCKKSDFGNGREARRLLENSIRCAAIRLEPEAGEGYEEKAMTLLAAEDIRQAMKEL